MLPYLTGERAPGWAGAARAVFGGVSAATDADTVRSYRDAFADAGADELICFPSSTDVEQVDLLAEAVL